MGSLIDVYMQKKRESRTVALPLVEALECPV